METAADTGRALITGGAGFIGANLANRLLEMGRPVTIFDNCSRAGVERNLHWLRARHGRLLTVEVADVRDPAAVTRAVASANCVFHLAAQVAVTTSLVDPLADFDVNARGTLNVLEAIRNRAERPPVILTSTNKVYGALRELPLGQTEKRWHPTDRRHREHGVSEDQPLDFRSPYGCSKGAADQYTLDYARSFGVAATVFRMSCIYGPRQLGTEDQGWVAHFLMRALDQRPICIFGDGKQVRDILYVEDLVDAFLLAIDAIDRVSGQAFNVGGGPGNAISLLDLLELITELHGERPLATFHDWRPCDQRYYVSDTRRLMSALDWAPRVSVRDGLERLYCWLSESRAPAVRELVAAAGEGFAREQHR